VTICDQYACDEIRGASVEVLSVKQYQNAVREKLGGILAFVAALVTIGFFGVNEAWKAFGADRPK
jgi:hypothetical protein